MTRLPKYLSTLAVVAFFFCPPTAQADTVLPAPTGRVILEISGAIEKHTTDEAAQFDLNQLKALPVGEITTSTPWTDGVTTFVGVSFEHLLTHVAAQGDTMRVTALNDYTATMSAQDLIEAGAILAYAKDGKRLTVRDKGPLWVIFPFDANEAYQTDAYWSMSVWQVKSISIE